MSWPLLACLVALIGIGVLLRDARMAGTAGVLTANWSACTAFVAATSSPVVTWQETYPWPVFGAFDYAAGFAILLLLRQDGRVTVWQGIIGALYAVELLIHAAVGVEVIANAHPERALYEGFQYLAPIAWAQVAIVGAWGGYELARRGWMPVRGLSARHARLGRDHEREARSSRRSTGVR